MLDGVEREAAEEVVERRGERQGEEEGLHPEVPAEVAFNREEAEAVTSEEERHVGTGEEVEADIDPVSHVNFWRSGIALCWC